MPVTIFFDSVAGRPPSKEGNATWAVITVATPALTAARNGTSSVLHAEALYLGDNGRCFCGRLHHAGMTAHFTGRDLSGQAIERVTEAHQREARRMGVTLACETCAVEERRA